MDPAGTWRGGDSKYPNHDSRVERGAPGLSRRAPDAEVRPEVGQCLERLNVSVRCASDTWKSPSAVAARLSTSPRAYSFRSQNCRPNRVSRNGHLSALDAGRIRPIGFDTRLLHSQLGQTRNLLALQEFRETKFGLLEPSSGPTGVWRHALEGLHRVGVGARRRERRGSLSPDHRSARWVREVRACRLAVTTVQADLTTHSLTLRQGP